MINAGYSLEQCKQMLKIMGKNKVQISAYGPWPEFIVRQFGEGSEFFFNDKGELFARVVRDRIITWTGSLIIDPFWQAKISQSLSFQLARHLKSLQSKIDFKEIGHLLCRFHNFTYIPSNIL